MADLLVNVDVSDIDEAVRFYTDGLGLHLRRRLGADVAELEGATCPVFLIQHPKGSLPFAGATSPRDCGRHWTPIHLDFVVADLDAAVRRAESAGAISEGDTREFDWGRYRIMSDPSGNGFCILQFKGAGYDGIG